MAHREQSALLASCQSNKNKSTAVDWVLAILSGATLGVMLAIGL